MGYYDNTKVGRLNKKAPKPKRPAFRIKPEDQPMVLAFIAAVAFMCAFGILLGSIYFFEWFDTRVNDFLNS